MTLTLDGLLVADSPESWVAAGFDVGADGVCWVGTVAIELVGPDRGKGIVGWRLGGLAEVPGDLDGIPSETSTGPGTPGAVHPNGVTQIDHVVLLSPNLPRTVAALADLGVEPRRERDGVLSGAEIRQIFFRLGPVILEVIGSAGEVGDGPSSLWGITYTVADIDETATFFGERTSSVKDAVQPGRRITTLRNREVGISVRTALISV